MSSISLTINLPELEIEMTILSQKIGELTAQVAAMQSIEQSAVAVLNSLVQQVQDAVTAGDLSGVQSAIDNISAAKDDLARAISTTTPAAPTSTADPPAPADPLPTDPVTPTDPVPPTPNAGLVSPP